MQPDPEIPTRPESTTSPAPTEKIGAPLHTTPRPGRYGGTLMPPWPPGRSGNPSGLNKNGKGTCGDKLKGVINEKLSKPTTMRRLANQWLKHAMKGSAPHLALLLDRVYPAKQAETQQGRIVFEGIRLEVAPLLKELQPVVEQGSSFSSIEEPEIVDVEPEVIDVKAEETNEAL